MHIVAVGAEELGEAAIQTGEGSRHLAQFAEYGEALRRDGVVCIRQALGDADLRLAEGLYSWTLNHPGQSAQDIAITSKGETMYTDVYSSVTRDHYRDELRRSQIPAIMAAVMGVEQLWYLGEQVIEKRGEASTRPTPWHQDTNMPIDKAGAVGMWMSFDQLDGDHALQFVRGSHHWPKLNPYLPPEPDGRIRQLYPYEDARHMPPFPDIDAEPRRFDLVRWETAPGDVVLFHNMTIHGGATVPPSGLRRTLCLRFFGPETRYEALPGRQQKTNLASEATDFLWKGLSEGMPLSRGDHFSQVFQA